MVCHEKALEGSAAWKNGKRLQMTLTQCPIRLLAREPTQGIHESTAE